MKIEIRLLKKLFPPYTSFHLQFKLHISNFRALSKRKEENLGPCLISMMELSCENNWRVLAVNHCCEKSQLQMFFRVLNVPLNFCSSSTISCIKWIYSEEQNSWDFLHLSSFHKTFLRNLLYKNRLAPQLFLGMMPHLHTLQSCITVSSLSNTDQSSSLDTHTKNHQSGENRIISKNYIGIGKTKIWRQSIAKAYYWVNKFKWLQQNSNPESLSSWRNTRPFSQFGEMIICSFKM